MNSGYEEYIIDDVVKRVRVLGYGIGLRVDLPYYESYIPTKAYKNKRRTKGKPALYSFRHYTFSKYGLPYKETLGVYEKVHSKILILISEHEG